MYSVCCLMLTELGLYSSRPHLHYPCHGAATRVPAAGPSRPTDSTWRTSAAVRYDSTRPAVRGAGAGIPAIRRYVTNPTVAPVQKILLSQYLNIYSKKRFKVRVLSFSDCKRWKHPYYSTRKVFCINSLECPAVLCVTLRHCCV